MRVKRSRCFTQISRIICRTTETYEASLSQNQRTSRVRVATNSQQIMALFVILSGGNYISFTDRLPLGLSRSLLLIRKLAPRSLPNGYRYRIRNNDTAMTNCHCAVHANCRTEPKSRAKGARGKFEQREKGKRRRRESKDSRE